MSTGAQMTVEPIARVLSLGGGVQSSALYMMAVLGDISPTPDFAIFADTRGEKESTYEWLWWLAERHGHTVPIIIWSVGDLALDLARSATEGGPRVSNPPLFTSPSGMLIQKCTRDYKVAAIKRGIRWRMGWGRRGTPPGVIEQWIGISVDEADRMKVSPIRWQRLSYPLIDRGLSRGDCESYLMRHARVPPKSCCVFCPYQSASRWLRMRDTAPRDWRRAVSIDEAIRGGIEGTREPLYLHRSNVPLSVAVHSDQIDLFGDECAGICGV